MRFRYSVRRHIGLLIVAIIGLIGLIASMYFGAHEMSLVIGLLTGWVIGLFQGVNAQIEYQESRDEF